MMLKEIIKNIFGRKKALPFREMALSAPEAEAAAAVREKIGGMFGRSVRIRQVAAGSCNACEWECTALANPVYDIQRFGIDFVASPRHADIILLSGPVSVGMAEALKKTHLATPGPKIVVACGDCARDGGVYRGSYAVTDGAANVVPVDCYIPGCPPTPAAILSAIAKALGIAG